MCYAADAVGEISEVYSDAYLTLCTALSHKYKLPPHIITQIIPREMFLRVIAICHVNAFAYFHSDAGHDSDEVEWQQVGTVLFGVGSYFNHSCKPNVVLRYGPPGQGVSGANFEALCNVAAGDELTLCYCDVKWDVKQRRAHLSRHYGFTCVCERCSAES